MEYKAIKHFYDFTILGMLFSIFFGAFFLLLPNLATTSIVLFLEVLIRACTVISIIHIKKIGPRFLNAYCFALAKLVGYLFLIIFHPPLLSRLLSILNLLSYYHLHYGFADFSAGQNQPIRTLQSRLKTFFWIRLVSALISYFLTVFIVVFFNAPMGPTKVTILFISSIIGIGYEIYFLKLVKAILDKMPSK